MGRQILFPTFSLPCYLNLAPLRNWRKIATHSNLHESIQNIGQIGGILNEISKPFTRKLESSVPDFPRARSLNSFLRFFLFFCLHFALREIKVTFESNIGSALFATA